MRTFFRLSFLAVIAAGVLVSGCSKKDPQLVDPTAGDPGPGTEIPGNTNTGGGNPGDNGVDTGGHEIPTHLEDVFFGLDLYSLSTESRRGLDANADVILLHPEWQVVLEGHCDERGTVEYNLALGQKRADSVRAYLADLGVPIDQMRSVSYGEESPFDPGHNEGSWAFNRRVHFVR